MWCQKAAKARYKMFLHFLSMACCFWTAVPATRFILVELWVCSPVLQHFVLRQPRLNLEQKACVPWTYGHLPWSCDCLKNPVENASSKSSKVQSPNITIDLYNTQINVIVFFLAAGFLNFQKSATKFCRSHQLIWFGTGLLKFSHSVCQNQTPWKFLLIKCGSLEQKLHLFCPSKKKGGFKNPTSCACFIVVRSSTKILEIATPSQWFLL